MDRVTGHPNHKCGECGVSLSLTAVGQHVSDGVLVSSLNEVDLSSEHPCAPGVAARMQSLFLHCRMSSCSEVMCCRVSSCSGVFVLQNHSMRSMY